MEELKKQFGQLLMRIQEVEKEKETKNKEKLYNNLEERLIVTESQTKEEIVEVKAIDKDFTRLLKVVGKVRFDPHDEEQFFIVVDQWEEACEMLDIDFWALQILSSRLGSEFVLDWIRKNLKNGRSWEEYKNALADYHQLEEKIMKHDRTWKISAAISTIIQSAARYQRFLERWGKSGELKDDKLKPALLNKVPKSEVANCLRVRDFMHISLYDFSRACRRCLHAATQQEKLQEEEKPVSVGAVHQEELENSGDDDEQFVFAIPSRKRVRNFNEQGHENTNPWAHVKCYNCGQKGHRVRDCPVPKKRCTVFGRVGHKSDPCWKSKHSYSIGGTKTTYSRRTKQGVHLDLVDQSTQGNLIRAMQQYRKLFNRGVEAYMRFFNWTLQYVIDVVLMAIGLPHIPRRTKHYSMH